MGVVYRARDVHLNRFAALKFLPDGAALDDDRKRRFLHEAQVASALNHPNIVTIYEIGGAPSQEFIAMEYVKGRSLDTLIGPGGLPVKVVLAYSAQIADALAAAHAAGVVHRDIKPANVIITGTGVAKVLDFGLAKLTEQPAMGTPDVTRTVAITSSSPTVEGAIVGTVSYMSPEQAEGKPVDHRSDIFSFGALLYEMLTGKRPFVGDSPVSTLAAILRAEPADLAQHLPDLPSEFVRIVRRCLEKSPDCRWQSMADIRLLLDDLKLDLQSTSKPAAGYAHRRFPLWPAAAVVAAIALSAAGTALWLRRAPAAPVQSYAFRRLTSDTGSNVSPAISPDGKLIAYSSDRAQSGATDIWVQQIAGGEPVRLTSGLGLCHSPSFSPDGSRIAFHGGPDARGIYVVSTFGGEPRRIADGRGPAFSPDGTQLSYMSANNDRIMLVPATGGTPREILVKHAVQNRPQWLPDGKRLLYLGADTSTPPRFDWYTIPADGGEEKSCGATKWLQGSLLRAVPHSVSSDGVLIYVLQADSANVYRVPFDVPGAQVAGPATPVTIAPGINFWPSASADGTKIVFGNAQSFNTNIWTMNVDPASGAVTGDARALTHGLVDRLAPYPSPNGQRLVYKANSGTTQDIRVLDLTSGKETRIVETVEATPPVISDDGTQIAYAVREKDALSIYTVPLTGGVPRRLCTGCGRPVEWFGRGSRILYDQAAKNTEIGILDVATAKSTTILGAQKETRIYTPRLSRDGRVLCFTRISGARERRTFIAPFAGDQPIPEQQWKTLTQASAVDERQAFWSPDGRFLYFLSEQDGFRCVWAVRFDASSMTAIGQPFPVHHLHQFRHSLLDFGDIADIGLSVLGKSMFLSVREIESNIWLAERKTDAPTRP
jgi:serine/threonine protein kinase